MLLRLLLLTLLLLLELLLLLLKHRAMLRTLITWWVFFACKVYLFSCTAATWPCLKLLLLWQRRRL